VRAVDATLPRWDVSNVFPSLTSREFAAAHEALGAAVSRLRALYDERGVRGGDRRAPGPAELAGIDEVIAATNEVLEAVRLLNAYVHALVTTDARDDEAARLRSQLQVEQAPLDALTARLEGWVASLGADALIAGSPLAADHAYPLRRAEESAAHRMSDAEEVLLGVAHAMGGGLLRPTQGVGVVGGEW